ncbi:MAG: 3'(2'),5'-bisphosphate nucleotidase CysQ, partial [Gammaproteobacteria bacterium]|nr:3'(2'),5'-bisphosphate nucleotidase CysQ [Gammaproteobacteria bacterium]
HALIVQGLGDITPHIPVLSEESGDLLASGIWREWTTYWLIDPLDGTKEFVKRNGEFTVNIALIHEHKAILGVVYVPVKQTTYAGATGLGAFKCLDNESDLDNAVKIRVTPDPQAPYRVVASRSHQSEGLKQYLAKLGEHKTVAMGSSLKFCLVAEGLADCYPRLGPTSEWDTAAAQAVVEAAGGAVEKLDGSPLRYNTKDEILNPFFMVHGKTAVDWFRALADDY